jgi:L-asparaginase II
LHNNCSGKHAGFLMLAERLGGGSEYVAIGHPVQQAVRAAFEEMTGAESPGYGIDGCSAPNFACTLHGLARAMARMADPRGLGTAREAAARRLVAAMLEHPLLVAGEGRACSELMVATGSRVVVKTGAEALFTAILPESGLGIALKIEDGTTRGSECAIAALLARMGLIARDDPALVRRLTPPILSRRGEVVGAVRPTAAFWAGGAAVAGL